MCLLVQSLVNKKSLAAGMIKYLQHELLKWCFNSYKNYNITNPRPFLNFKYFYFWRICSRFIPEQPVRASCFAKKNGELLQCWNVMAWLRHIHPVQQFTAVIVAMKTSSKDWPEGGGYLCKHLLQLLNIKEPPPSNPSIHPSFHPLPFIRGRVAEAAA